MTDDAARAARIHEHKAPVVLSAMPGTEIVAVSVDRAGLVRWEERDAVRAPDRAGLDDAALEAFLDDLYQRGVDTAPEIRAALNAAGYRIALATGDSEGPGLDEIDELGHPIAINEYGRAQCTCGISVLPQNWANHLLRQDGRVHRAARLPYAKPDHAAPGEKP